MLEKKKEVLYINENGLLRKIFYEKAQDMFDQVMDHLYMSSLRTIMKKKIDTKSKKAHRKCLRGSTKPMSEELCRCK